MAGAQRPTRRGDALFVNVIETLLCIMFDVLNRLFFAMCIPGVDVPPVQVRGLQFNFWRPLCKSDLNQAALTRQGNGGNKVKAPDTKKPMKEKSADRERPRPAPDRMLELAAGSWRR